MREYKAFVKDAYTGKYTVITSKADNKAEFIKELRQNGYKVNPLKVKNAELFDYIVNNTNLNPWDWELRKIPTNY